MQQNFSESVKPRAEAFPGNRIGCITAKYTFGKSFCRDIGLHTCVEFFHTRTVTELRGGAKVAKYPQKS